MNTFTVHLSIQETIHLEAEARRRHLPAEQLLNELASRAVLRFPLPPVPTGPRHLQAPRETQTERRARLRALDPDGKSPYTRELETITGRNQA